MRLIMLLYFLVILTIGNARSRKPRICTTGQTAIRKSEELNVFKDCDVIEGSIYIGYVMGSSEASWLANGNLPAVEITGYLVVAFSKNLRSIGTIFPHLTVIRGQTLFEDYALVVYLCEDLQTIGLSNLTTIYRGSVNIDANPKLDYYARKIDWGLITRTNISSNIQNVRSPIKICNSSCEIGHCWSSTSCQKVCPSKCSEEGKSCDKEGNCCHSQCLGGCTKPNDHRACVACKGVRDGAECRKSCGDHQYMVDNYRCIEDLQCKYENGSIIESERRCTRGCPPGYIATLSTKNGHSIPSCLPCNGTECNKVCNGGFIHSVLSAERFQRCTKINGSLEIRLSNGRDLEPELEKHLGWIREITGYLHIFESKSLHHLKFLENLTIIDGEELMDGYSLIVRDNVNLENLWKNGKNLKILKGDLSIYKNRKLCSKNIENLVGTAVYEKHFPDEDLRNVLNGNKFDCDEHNILPIQLESPWRKGVVMVVVDRMHIVNDARKLMGFHIYYQETKDESLNFYSESQWNVIYKEYKQKDSQILVRNLKPDTKYGFYVTARTTVTSSRKYQSKILYATTKQFNPSSPLHPRVTGRTENSVEVEWDPPRFPNGNLHHYIVRATPKIREIDHTFDYCLQMVRKQFQKAEDENGQVESLGTKSAPEGSSRSSECSPSSNYLEDEIESRNKQQKFQNRLAKFHWSSSSGANRKKRSVEAEEYLDESYYQVYEDDQGLTMSIPSRVDQHLSIEERLRLEKEEELLTSKLKMLAESNDFDINPYLGENGMVEDINTLEQLKRDFEEEYEEEVFNVDIVAPEPKWEGFDGGIEITGIKNTSMNLTLKPTEYKIEIWACLKIDRCPKNRTSPCQLCSIVPSEISTYTLRAESLARVQNVIITESNDSVSWQHQARTNMTVLAYDIVIKNWENGINQPFCRNSNVQHLTFNLSPGEYAMKVVPYYLSFSHSLEDIPLKNFTVADKPLETYNFLGMSMIGVILFFLVVIVILCLVIKRSSSRSGLQQLRESVNPLYWLAGYRPWIDGPLSNVSIHRDHIVKEKNLEILSTIGSGHFGQVSKGTLVLSPGDKPILVAVKQPQNRGEIESFLMEAALALTLETHHLIKSICVVRCKKYPSLVMELMSNGNLRDFITDSRKPEHMDIFEIFPIELVTQFFIQIADGMYYLVSHNILHRDLAARNVLLDDRKNAKISDFGLSRETRDGYYFGKMSSNTRPIPVRWMPPEFFLEEKFTKWSDVWSYGILMWEVVTMGGKPYGDYKNEEIQDRIRAGHTLATSIPPIVPTSLSGLMVRCWHNSSNRRPPFNIIIQELLPISSEEFRNRFKKASFYWEQADNPHIGIDLPAQPNVKPIEDVNQGIIYSLKERISNFGGYLRDALRDVTFRRDSRGSTRTYCEEDSEITISLKQDSKKHDNNNLAKKVDEVRFKNIKNTSKCGSNSDISRSLIFEPSRKL